MKQFIIALVIGAAITAGTIYSCQSLSKDPRIVYAEDQVLKFDDSATHYYKLDSILTSYISDGTVDSTVASMDKTAMLLRGHIMDSLNMYVDSVHKWLDSLGVLKAEASFKKYR